MRAFSDCATHSHVAVERLDELLEVWDRGRYERDAELDVEPDEGPDDGDATVGGGGRAGDEVSVEDGEDCNAGE